jgi:hypothetical protein
MLSGSERIQQVECQFPQAVLGWKPRGVENLRVKGYERLVNLAYR